jgi:hypothetical protein
MTALKTRAGSLPALIAVVLAIGILIGVALVGIGADAGTNPPKAAAKTPVAHSACQHYADRLTAPCVVGNIVVNCGYGLGSCEYSQYLRCKISGEKGKVVKYIVDPGEGIEGTRIENPYKVVTCHGSAKILRVYLEEFTAHYQSVTVHGAHSLTVTLHYRRHGFRDDALLIFAQH